MLSEQTLLSKDEEQSADHVGGDRRVEVGQRSKAGLPGAHADPDDRLAFLVGRVATDEPADDELDEFVAVAVRVAQDAVPGGDVRHGSVADAVTVGDLVDVDAGYVVGEDALTQPLRQPRRVRPAPFNLVTVEDPVEPGQPDLMRGADRADCDVGLVVGNTAASSTATSFRLTRQVTLARRPPI
jgi:hypothetical protein